MGPGGRMACETMMIMKGIKVYVTVATPLTGVTVMIRIDAMIAMKMMMMIDYKTKTIINF
jgi:hypothetical protein